MSPSGAQLRSGVVRRRRSGTLLLFLSLFVLLFGVTAPAVQANEAESRVYPPLLVEATRNPNKKFRVLITRQNGGERFEAANLKGVGGRWLKRLPQGALDGMVVELPGKVIRRLGQHRAIKYIAPDAPLINTCVDCAAINATKLATMFARASGASSVWPTTANGAGWTGKGVGIAILDTGINNNRLDWSDAQGRSRIVNAPVFSSGQAVREDGHGHGTHVAGIAAGNSWYRTANNVRGKYIGVAPEATLIDVKVSDDRGASYISDLVTAIDWVVANRATYNIRVMNLSLVSSVAESYKTSVLAAAVERAWFNGILVVVAAGNAGPNTLQYPPANDPFVITVGASDPLLTVDRRDDQVAPWSSYGTTQDGFSKPELVAPGRVIVAPLTSANSNLALALSGRITDDSYIWLSGTSMAAPVVAGIGALAFQAHPEWTNDQVKWLLMQTATPLRLLGRALPGSGAGAVDARAVVNYTGVPQGANQGVAISNLLSGPSGVATYMNSSWTSSSWSSSSWSSSSWSASSWSSSSWSSSSWSSSSWSTSTDVVSCGAKCDTGKDDSLKSGQIIPFRDPAVEMGFTAEPRIKVP